VREEEGAETKGGCCCCCCCCCVSVCVMDGLMAGPGEEGAARGLVFVAAPALCGCALQQPVSCDFSLSPSLLQLLLMVGGYCHGRTGPGPGEEIARTTAGWW
jgi:hypothetical protein